MELCHSRCILLSGHNNVINVLVFKSSWADRTPGERVIFFKKELSIFLYYAQPTLFFFYRHIKQPASSLHVCILCCGVAVSSRWMNTCIFIHVDM